MPNLLDLLLAQPLVILMHDFAKLPRSWDYQKGLRINMDAVKSQTRVSIRAHLPPFSLKAFTMCPPSPPSSPGSGVLKISCSDPSWSARKINLELLFMVTLILLLFHFCVYLTMYVMYFESNTNLEHRNKCTCIEDAPNSFIRRMHPQFKNKTKTGFKQ